jgi:signal peptidase I
MRPNGSRGGNGLDEEVGDVGADPDGADRDGGTEDADEKPRRRWRRTILEWLGVIGGGIAIALLVEAFLIQAFWIPSPSMEPTLDVGDRVLVNKLSYKFHDVNRGDVVVFERPPGASTGQNDEIKDLIKRVIAVGGDTIEAKEGDVYVNGERIDENYLEPGTPTDNLPLKTIPDGQVFVMGDNRTNSEDSRIFGSIDEDAIVGRAFIRVLPITDIGWL